MKLLVDVGVGKAVERWLANQGMDVAAVRDLDPHMTDVAILAWAAREQRLVITMDKDFGELAVHQAKLQAGVLLLRLGDAPSEEKVLVVQRIFELHSEVLPDHFCVYQNGRLRVRPLPE